MFMETENLHPHECYSSISIHSAGKTLTTNKHTSIDLFNPWQCQFDFVPIRGHCLSLQRVSFEIYRHKLLRSRELLLDLLERREFVVACPELFEVCQVFEVFEFRYLVVGYIKDAEVFLFVVSEEKWRRWDMEHTLCSRPEISVIALCEM